MLIAEIYLNEFFIIFSLNNHRKISLILFLFFNFKNISSLMIIILKKIHIRMINALFFFNHIII